MSRWWHKSKPQVVDVEPFEAPRELTGIEKHEREQFALEQVQALKAARIREAELKCRIAEIEQQIGPQLSELRQLRVELNPNRYITLSGMQSMQQAQMQALANYGLAPFFGAYGLLGGSLYDPWRTR